MMVNLKYIYKIGLFLLTTFFTLSVNSCYEDKGNYDLTELNDILIINIEDVYYTNIGDEIEINPVLVFKHEKQTNDLSYEWHKVSENKNKQWNSEVMLSEESVLKMSVGGAFAYTGGHDIIFRVKDENTGVYYWKKFRIQVGSNPLASGYVALCEKPDGFDIDMISHWGKTSKEAKFTVYPNVLDLMGSDFPRIGNPVAIQCVSNDNLAPYPGDSDVNRVKRSVFVSTDQISARVKYEDFSYLPEYDLSSICTLSSIAVDEYFPNGIIVDKYITQNWNKARVYMYINNNWFFYNTAGNAYNYLSYPINRTFDNSTEFSKPFKTAPFLYSNANHGGILFNEDENRFMHHNTLGSLLAFNTILSVSYISDADDGKDYSFNNPNYRLIYLGTISLPENMALGYAIVDNMATQKFELLEFQVNNVSGGLAKTNWIEFDYDKAPDLREAKFFAYRHISPPAANLSATNVAPYLYYATEDKVYSFHTSTATKNDITSQVTEGPYTKISAMKYTIPWGGKNLIIATYDPNGEVGKNGRLTGYVENFGDSETAGDGSLSIEKLNYSQYIENEEGEIIEEIKVEYLKSFTGIGKVIDLSYKE